MRGSLGTIRGQLVIWYLAVLAAVLLALGIVQSVTLTDYLRSSTARSIRTSAFTELRVLGPCFIRSSAQLESNAPVIPALRRRPVRTVAGAAGRGLSGSGSGAADPTGRDPGSLSFGEPQQR